MKAICTRSFQRHGGIARSGQTIILSQAERSDPFVMARVKPVEDGAQAPEPVYMGNGVPVQDKKPPAAEAKEFDPDTATVDALRAKLTELGIVYSTRQTKGELQALYAKVAEAIAGSPEQTRKPEV